MLALLLTKNTTQNVLTDRKNMLGHILSNSDKFAMSLGSFDNPTRFFFGWHASDEQMQHWNGFTWLTNRFCTNCHTEHFKLKAHQEVLNLKYLIDTLDAANKCLLMGVDPNKQTQ